jgi:hypothetical protein
MRPIVKWLIAGTVSAAILSSQSLHVPPSSTGAKTPGSFSVMIDSPDGKAPVALQWEFSIPAAIAVETADITIGKVAESAKKSITCVAKSAKEGAARYACILAGGQNPLGNGETVVVRYRPKKDVQGAPIRVAIENVIAVSADLKPVSIPNADAIIRIR